MCRWPSGRSQPLSGPEHTDVSLPDVAPSNTADTDQQRVRLQSQTDRLVDAITGSARAGLEKMPVAVIYASLCDQIRGMGLEPHHTKVLRIATWISATDPTEPTTDSND